MSEENTKFVNFVKKVGKKKNNPVVHSSRVECELKDGTSFVSRCQRTIGAKILE